MDHGPLEFASAWTHAVQGNLIASLQQENGDLKGKVSELTRQSKAIEDQHLPQVIDGLNSQIAQLTPKAQLYATLKSRYDELVPQLSQLESLRKERDQFKLERDQNAKLLQTAAPARQQSKAVGPRRQDRSLPLRNRPRNYLS